MREKVPYEDRTRRSDRAGKTRTALLEKRTALPETATIRQNRCELMTKTILLPPKFVLSKMSHGSEHSESEFYHPGELSHAEPLHQSATHSKSKERNLTLLANLMKKLTTFSEASKQTRGQGNNFSE